MASSPRSDAMHALLQREATLLQHWLGSIYSRNALMLHGLADTDAKVCERSRGLHFCLQLRRRVDGGWEGPVRSDATLPVQAKSVDLLILWHVLDGVADRDPLWRELIACLAPGGVVLSLDAARGSLWWRHWLALERHPVSAVGWARRLPAKRWQTLAQRPSWYRPAFLHGRELPAVRGRGRVLPWAPASRLIVARALDPGRTPVSLGELLRSRQRPWAAGQPVTRSTRSANRWSRSVRATSRTSKTTQ